MTRTSNTVFHEVRGKCIRETEKAFLFTPTHISGKELPEERGASWFPFFQIQDKFCLTGEGEHWFMGSEWILGTKDLLP